MQVKELAQYSGLQRRSTIFRHCQHYPEVMVAQQSGNSDDNITDLQSQVL